MYNQQFNQKFVGSTSVGQNQSKGYSNIILNQTNILSSDPTNSTLVYNFPNSVSFPNHEISVQSISMYYSWVNISNSPSLNNNNFTYTWTDAVSTLTYTVTIPNGIYELADINNYLQFVMINNGHYLINSSGQNVYYAELIVNVNKYSFDINTFPVPTSLPSGWVTPVANPATGALAFTSFPLVAINPIITLPATNNFYKIMGYTAGFVTTNTAPLNYSVSSSISPQIQPNPTLFLSCTNINNIYATPTSIIYSITPTVSIASQIVDKLPEYAWNNISGTTSNLTFTFRGNNQSIISIIDPNMTISLIIREKSLV